MESTPRWDWISDDAVLDALKGVENDNGAQGFDFDFDDSDEQIIEEEALTFHWNARQSIQRAAVKSLFTRHGLMYLTYTLNREEMYTKWGYEKMVLCKALSACLDQQE